MNETAKPVNSRRRFSPAWPVKNLPAGAEALIPELDNPSFEGIEDPTDNTETITRAVVVMVANECAVSVLVVISETVFPSTRGAGLVFVFQVSLVYA